MSRVVLSQYAALPHARRTVGSRAKAPNDAAQVCFTNSTGQQPIGWGLPNSGVHATEKTCAVSPFGEMKREHRAGRDLKRWLPPQL
jgi:hypothetical protein